MRLRDLSRGEALVETSFDPVPPPSRLYDFTAGTTPAGATLVRAGPADARGPSGDFTTYAANAPVWDYAWDGAAWARSTGVRLAPAQTNVFAAGANPASWAFSSRRGDIDSGLACSFSTSTENGVTVVDAHLTGTTPDGESYAYLTADKAVAGTTTLSAAAAAQAVTLNLADVSNLVVYQTVTVGAGATSEDVRISKIVITGSNVTMGDGSIGTDPGDGGTGAGQATGTDDGSGAAGSGDIHALGQNLGVLQPGTITIATPLVRAHASGETVTRYTGLLTPDGSSISALGFARILAANKLSDFTWDFRTEGGGDTDTGSLSERLDLTVTKLPAESGNWINNRAQARAYYRLHFTAAATWDLTIRLGPLTLLANQFPVCGPILNAGSGAKTRAAESWSFDLAPGTWDIVVDAQETGVEVLRGVVVADGGWTLDALPQGAWHLKAVAAYPALPDVVTRREPPTCSLVPGIGETLDGGGAVVAAVGPGGMTATLLYSSSSDDEGMGANVIREGDLTMWRVAPGYGQYQLGGFEFSDGFSVGLSFRSASLLKQALIGAGVGTDDANSRVQLLFNEPLAALLAAVDHVAVSRTIALSDDFSQPVRAIFTKDGPIIRWDVNANGNVATVWARDVKFLPSGSYKVLFQSFLDANQFDGDFFGFDFWAGPLSPTQSARDATAEGARLQALAAVTPVVPVVTRVTTGAQVPDGFTFTWDASAVVPVLWEASRDGFATVDWAQTIAPTPTDRSPSRSWYSGKTVVSGLRSATGYQLRPSIAGAPGPIASVKTAPAAGAAASMRVLLMSCTKFGSNPVPALASAAMLEPFDFALHLGDLVYANINYNDVRAHRARLIRTFGANRHGAAILLASAFLHIWDDHDSGPNNNDRTLVLPTQPDGVTPTMLDVLTNGRAAWQETMPHPPLASSARCLAWEQDYGHIRVITPDLFSQRRPLSNTVMNFGSPAFDQRAWLRARLAAAGAAGRKLVILAISSWDNWRRLVPAEWQQLVDDISTTPGIPYTLVVTGDIHRSYVDDGTTAGLPTVCSSPAMHSTGIQVPVATTWGAGAGLSRINDPMQFATLEINAAGDFNALLFGSPHTADGATFLGRRSTTTLPTPKVAFRTATQKVVTGTAAKVFVDRSLFSPKTGTVHWSATNGQSGDLTWSPMLRTQAIVLNAFASGSVTVTLSAPVGCTIGQATTIVSIGTQMTTAGGTPMFAADGTPMFVA